MTDSAMGYGKQGQGHFSSNSDTIKSPREAQCLNAGEYEFPEGSIFLYLFNSFDEFVMAQVVGQLRKALELRPRFVRIVCFHPNFLTSLLTMANIKLLRNEIFHDRKSINDIGRVAIYEIAPR